VDNREMESRHIGGDRKLARWRTDMWGCNKKESQQVVDNRGMERQQVGDDRKTVWWRTGM
jgi:hypothetical protein